MASSACTAVRAIPSTWAGTSTYITPRCTIGMLSITPAASGLVHVCVQPADVLFVDLIERTVTLRVVGAAEHQPIVGAGVQQHRARHRRKAPALRDDGGDSAARTIGITTSRVFFIALPLKTGIGSPGTLGVCHKQPGRRGSGWSDFYWYESTQPIQGTIVLVRSIDVLSPTIRVWA